jgi:hypothetical protein
LADAVALKLSLDSYGGEGVGGGTEGILHAGTVTV